MEGLLKVLKGHHINGLIPGMTVEIVSTDSVGDDAVNIVYRTPDGKLGDRMLFKGDEAKLSIAEEGLPWSFTATQANF